MAAARGGSGGGSAYANTLDPDSYFGFSAKIEDFNYRFLGEKQMLASVHAVHSPEPQCPFDGGKTICPEDWEMRHLYVIEADAKPGRDATIPKRIFYIDSEGWFITASDQYDRDGKLWKTIATFNTYRDRPVPDARVAIYPYKRMFQLGWSMRISTPATVRSSICPERPRPIANAGISIWEWWTTPFWSRWRWSAPATDREESSYSCSTKRMSPRRSRLPALTNAEPCIWRSST